MSTYLINAPPVVGNLTILDRQFVRPDRYRWDFDVAGDGWDTGGAQSTLSGGIYTTISPWSDDTNHDPPGRVNHTFVRLQSAWEETVNGVITNPVMFTNAMMTLRFRGVGYSPGATQCRPWVQSRFPGGIDKYTNYFMNSVDYTSLLVDGNWHTITTMLVSDAAAWTYAPYVNPDPNGRYGFLDFYTAQEHVHNFFPMMLTRATGSAAASGQIQLDFIDILYLRKIALTQPDPGGWITVFNAALNTGSTLNNGYSFRGITDPSATAGSEVRVTMKASPSGASSASKVSIGKHLTGNKTVATPIEVKWGGVSGFNLQAGQETPPSDPITLATAIGDRHVVHYESTSSAQARTSGNFAGGCYYGSFPNTWNVAEPSGTWDQTALYFGASKVEVK